jgi:predicted nucleic acid-binding protein
MLQMPNTIISNTSCFIILSNIGELNILQKVYGQLITTIEIATEFGEQLPDLVSIHQVTDKYR